MSQKSLTALSLIIAALIGAALLYVRVISSGFVLGTDTFSHPYKSFVAALMVSGLAWVCLIQIFKRSNASSLNKQLWAFVFLGAVLRAMF